ncbi:MAG: SDR family oxidoreductase [Theionarchaea archaeon]|nr:SDR family oxidoreductase [Theionarchaea archaeon]MBU7001114.1 SDR family oxidoreductase [Theionarchaea archaeon]MBU7020603.1 SDR family oxidoreductase [Theionarchaea archaeon]MBU7034252.1 SDR family oxidoreductase [Theionarchaea archaeon]MBU7039326.1 SDR family oxidoreductase [Theionarchaea archaeon]
MNPSRDKVALITGASSGLGEAYARKLASQGYDLVLVARREERLSALSSELQADYPITAEVLVADLTRERDIKRVETTISDLDHIDILINNAGFGTTGTFAEVDLKGQLGMITLYVVAPTRLIRAALHKMEKGGSIINVASLGAFIKVPGNVTYCAAKSYLVVFSETLQIELKEKGIRVQALCPGFARTEFHGKMGGFDSSVVPKVLWMNPEDVVKESLKALEKGKVVCIPGLRNRIVFILARIGVSPFLLKLYHLQ